MTKPIREQRREKLAGMITDHGERTRTEGVALAAQLLDVSENTVNAWLKPEAAKGSNPVPTMALELLEIKLDRIAASAKAARKGGVK